MKVSGLKNCSSSRFGSEYLPMKSRTQYCPLTPYSGQILQSAVAILYLTLPFLFMSSTTSSMALFMLSTRKDFNICSIFGFRIVSIFSWALSSTAEHFPSLWKRALGRRDPKASSSRRATRKWDRAAVQIVTLGIRTSKSAGNDKKTLKMTVDYANRRCLGGWISFFFFLPAPPRVLDHE